MFELLKRLYNEKRLPKENLKNAVLTFNWITAEEYQIITGDEYE